ncbi:MAG: aldehyde dehydrogenase family protein, partial [Pseudomonadota bacterium]
MADSSGREKAMTPAEDVAALIARLGVAASVSAPVSPASARPGSIISYSPIDGAPIGSVMPAGLDGVVAAIAQASTAAAAWRSVPPPRRGELVRRFGMKLRESKDDLGRLVTLENGKILQ